jgi:RND superfamily putative drug exporter
VNFEIKGDADKAEDKVDPILAQTKAAQQAHPDLRIEEFGGASSGKAISKMFDDDLKKAETISLPVTLAILLFAFGALVAAGLPLLLGLTAVAATMGLVSLVSPRVPGTENLSSVVVLVGLAVGVDYSLFYIRREREERRAGRDPRPPSRRPRRPPAAPCSSPASPSWPRWPACTSPATTASARWRPARSSSSASRCSARSPCCPRMLSKLGDRIDKGRIPFLGKRMARRSESRVWSAILDRVLRRPLVAALLSGGLLVALATPDARPAHRERRLERDPDRHAGQADLRPHHEGVPRRRRVGGGRRQGRRRHQAAGRHRDPRAAGPRRRRTSRSTRRRRRLAEPDRRTVMIPIAGKGTDDASIAALQKVRDDLVPATVGNVRASRPSSAATPPARRTTTTWSRPTRRSCSRSSSAWPSCCCCTTFRSIVIPIKAIVLNLLSVGAAYGVLVLVFQHGWGESLLGFKSTGAIEPWLPLFLFVILFGLSMDYHVFILSRVREAFDRGMSTEDAVAHGIKSTASVVTSAAIVMVAVFAIFATLSSIIFKQLGVGLAVAILIDATIVRASCCPRR